MSLEIRAITTNIQATVSGAEGHLSGEIDSRAWGYNGGRTQFFPGDDVFVIIYVSKNVGMVGLGMTGGPDSDAHFIAGSDPSGNPKTSFEWHANTKINQAVDTAGIAPQIPPDYATGGTQANPGTLGYHIQREALQFNSPIANLGKPYLTDPIYLGKGSFHPSAELSVANVKYIHNTTMVRLNKWPATLSPAIQPPHGFIYVEYVPSAVIGVIKDLSIPKDIKIFSYPNNLVLYGIATPLFPDPL